MIMQFWLYLSDMGCEISVQRSQRVAIPLLEQLLDALLPHLRRHVARRSIVAHFAMLGSNCGGRIEFPPDIMGGHDDR